MKLKDLMYFNKLAELKNYTDVSQYYDVKQPTVTMAIKRLENNFNVELVNRNQSHHNVKLTNAGLRLEEHVKIISDQVNEIEQEMGSANDHVIRFGLPPIIGNYYFPKLASELLSLGILNDMDNSESGSQKLLSELKDGHIDLALLGSSAPLESSEISSRILTSDTFKIVVNPKSHLAEMKSVRFADLKNEEFVGLSDDFVHTKVFSDMCDLHSIHPNIKYHTSDIELAKQLVSENVGITFLVSNAIKSTDPLISIPINDASLPPFYVSMAYRKSHVLLPKEKELINVLTKSITQKK